MVVLVTAALPREAPPTRCAAPSPRRPASSKGGWEEEGESAAAARGDGCQVGTLEDSEAAREDKKRGVKDGDVQQGRMRRGE